VALEELSAEQRDVLATLAQRRQLDREHHQPVVEILPEPALLDLGGEIAVGRADDPDVDLLLRVAPTDGSSLLEHAQELGLQLTGISPFVEEQRAAIGDLNRPFLSLSALVNAPRLCEQLDSRRFSGSAAQFLRDEHLVARCD